MTDVVVARYNENVDWCKNFKNSRVFIYDKSGINNGWINLPNVGREAHTYLTHIINNYDNLSEYVCFLQGNPFDGAKGYLNIRINELDDFNANVDFYNLSYYTVCNLDGTPHHPNLNIDEIIFDRFFINKPQFLKFPVGALFIASKRAILNRSKQFYIDILNEFNRTDIDNSLTGGGGGAKGNKMPWICERIWPYIFNRDYKTKYDLS